MAGERSLIIFQHEREAGQRFDYFLLSVSVALCAYIGQSIVPQKLGLNPYTLEIISVLLIIASTITGILRIEAQIMLYQANAWRLHLAEQRGKFVTSLATPGEIIDAASGNAYTQKQMQEEIAKIERQLPKAEKDQSTSIKKAHTYYAWRNWLLVSGFVGLFVSKLLVPYFH